jgi:hypothetical protein
VVKTEGRVSIEPVLPVDLLQAYVLLAVNQPARARVRFP